MICLDTDVVSVFLRRGAPPPAQRRLAETVAESHATSSITLGELLYGAARRGSATLMAAVHDYLFRDVTVVPFDEASARVYATIRVDLEAAGRPLDRSDLQIAAICLAHDLTLVTGNTRHFERVPGLRVENWLE